MTTTSSRGTGWTNNRGRTRGRPARLCAAAVLLIACAQTPQGNPPERKIGASRGLGDGMIASYVDIDADYTLRAMGVLISAGALNSLPQDPSDMHQCFDADGNDSVDVMTECSHWHEFVLPLPSEASRRLDLPFKWALFNWNPAGHIPPGVWDVPHFDVHFYIEPIENIFALKRGPCGPEFLRCDQFELATKPVPANYVHPDYEDVGAAAPGMGNHLIDPSAPEFHGAPFKRHFIYGVYDERVIFYEEMVARSYLLSKPNTCYAIKAAPDVAIWGQYPRTACVRYDPQTDQYTVSMEDFILREARPPRP